MSKKRDTDKTTEMDYDEWGDPVRPREKPPVSKEHYTDEWGDPVSSIPVNEEVREHLNEQQKYALEKRLVREDMIYPRAHYKPRGRLRGIIAICLAFLLGIFAGLGALVGVGAWAGTRAKLKDLLGENVGKFVNPEYTDMTVLDFLTTFIGDLSGGIDTLEDIAKYTPVVDTLIDKINETTGAYGIEFTGDLRDDLLKAKFTDLGEFMMDRVVNTIELGKTLDVKGDSDPILLALCYGEEGIDYTVGADGSIQPVPGGRAPTSIGDLMKSPTDTLSGLRLGTLMQLNKEPVTEETFEKNAMMFALCYGKRGVDYDIDENGRIVVLSKNEEAEAQAEDGGEFVLTFPVTVGDLMNHSSEVIKSLELGSMLGIDVNVTDDKIEQNGMMYALCYGVRGVDYDVQDGMIVMRDGHDEKYPVKVTTLTDKSSDLIQGMEIETLMSVKPGSDKLMHYLAYGSEMAKGTAPYTPADGGYTDAEGRAVDRYGYLLGEDGNYLTETTGEGETAATQYAGGGRYVYTYAEDGETVNGVTMLTDPATQKPYPKRTINDLTKEDANVLEGMKIGDVIEIGPESSPLMKTFAEWTIDDLSDESKIEGLSIGSIVSVDETSSKIMQALQDKTIGDLKDQKTIDALTLSDVVDIKDDTAGIIKAMRNWSLGDLQNQNRINRLKLGQIVAAGDSKLMQAISDWRIGDLSKQEKIDSLKLSDVIDLENATGILASLKDAEIGNLQTKIDSITLAEMLGSEAVEGNKLLKPLAGSTIDTLSDDLKTLSVGDVFGDEIYSFLDMKGGTYEELYAAYEKEYATNKDLARPTPYTAGEKKVTMSDVTVKYFHDETELSLGYFTEKGVFGSLYTGELKFDPAIASENRKPEAVFKTPYYCENRIDLTPVYEFKLVNYTTGALDPLAGTVSEKDGKYTYAEGGVSYEIQEDDLGYFYTVTVDGKATQYDLERVITGYTLNGEPYEGKEKVSQDKNGYYITERADLYEGYYAGSTIYEEGVTEKYFYGTTELDRYVDGVWYMLLSKDGTVNADVAVLELDGQVTGVSDALMNAPLWELYFRGVISENPYVEINKLYQGLLGDKTVTNLNELKINDVINFMQALMSHLSDLPFGG